MKLAHQSVVAPRSFRYARRSKRLALIESLLEYVAGGRAIPGHLLRFRSESLGVSTRTLRRWIAEASAEPAPSRAWTPPRELLVRTAEFGGNLRRAREDLCAEGVAMPSYSTVCAAVNRDHPMLLLALRSGIDAYRHYLPVLENSIVGRNAVWYIDETKLPVRTIGRDGVATEAVWLVSVLDGATRLVLAHLVVEGAVNALHATSVLAAAALGWMHENERVGGRPEALVSDNALIYKSNDFARCTAALGIPHLFAQPHSPGGKARIERWHRTIKDSGLSYLPGWSRGPRDTVHLTEPDPHTGRTVREVRHLMPPDHALLPVDDVAAAVAAFIDEYNVAHVVEPLGCTPIEAWHADEEPVRRAEVEALWDWATPYPTARKVQRQGVHVDGEYFQWAGSDRIVGSVEVRALPGIDDVRLIGLEGSFLAAARRALTSQDRRSVQLRRSGRISTAKSILAEARERRASITDGAGDASPVLLAHGTKPVADRPPLRDTAGLLQEARQAS
jgi:transposase InsO family protein